MRIRTGRTLAGLMLAAGTGIGIQACSTNPTPGTTIYMNPDSSGYVESGTHHLAVHGLEPVIGDVNSDTPGSIVRGLVEFPIDTIPSTATVTSATLELTQCLVVGAPYTVHGHLYVDHLVYADPFDTSAFDAPALDTTGGIFSTSPVLGRRTIVVTAAVQADLTAGRTKSQFRLSMPTFDTTSTDTTSNYTVFNTEGSHSHACASPAFNANPALVVKYH